MDLVRRARTEAVREAAHGLGFHAVGFAAAGHADPEGRLPAWIARAGSTEMRYMLRNPEDRSDPRRLVEGARTVVALAISYYRPEYVPAGRYKVSRYAVSDDYHRVVKKKVRRLRRRLLEIEPGARVMPTVDTSPVLERAWAERAGIAWIGKSTMAIGRSLGTYTFLATLITTLELEPDAAHDDFCGTCTRCLDACPTDAFVGPYELDPTRCITYWNVEHRGAFDATTPPLYDWLAGCDVCQEVCPWNKFARPADEPRLAVRPPTTRPPLQDAGAVRDAIQGDGPSAHRSHRPVEKCGPHPGPASRSRPRARSPAAGLAVKPARQDLLAFFQAAMLFCTSSLKLF